MAGYNLAQSQVLTLYTLIVKYVENRMCSLLSPLQQLKLKLYSFYLVIAFPSPYGTFILFINIS